jgi:hypothetical protein
MRADYSPRSRGVAEEDAEKSKEEVSPRLRGEDLSLS